MKTEPIKQGGLSTNFSNSPNDVANDTSLEKAFWKNA